MNFTTLKIQSNATYATSQHPEVAAVSEAACERTLRRHQTVQESTLPRDISCIADRAEPTMSVSLSGGFLYGSVFVR